MASSSLNHNVVSASQAKSKIPFAVFSIHAGRVSRANTRTGAPACCAPRGGTPMGSSFLVVWVVFRVVIPPTTLMQRGSREPRSAVLAKRARIPLDIHRGARRVL